MLDELKRVKHGLVFGGVIGAVLAIPLVAPDYTVHIIVGLAVLVSLIMAVVGLQSR